MSVSEQRRSQRIRFSCQAVVHYGPDLSLSADVDTHDISLHGLFLKTSQLLPMDTRCEIEISLSGSTSSMLFLARGMVCRHDATGMAVNFTQLDPDSYLHILNLVKLHEAE